MTAKIRKDSLEVTLRARDTNSSRAVEFVKSWPITAAQRERLLSCPGTVLARDGYQAITPYFDDARRPESADLSAQAPGNRWRFAGEEETYRLYRAMSKLKDDAPASLRELAGTMARAMDSDEKTRRTAMKQYAARWPRVAQDVQGLKSAAADEALAELTGVNLEFAVDTSASNQLALNATVRSSLHGVNGRIALSAASARLLGGTPDAETVTVKAGDTRKAQWRWDVQSGASDVAEITATAALQCGGFTMSVKRTREVSLRQSVPCWYVMGPFDNPGGAEADIAHAPEKEPFSPAASYPGIGTNGPVTWRRCVRGADLGVGSDFVVDFNSLYGPASNVAGYAVTWVDSPVETNAVLAVGSEDGFIAWVNGERVGGVLKPARSYASRGDRVPIHLKQGENEIRLKITLSQYGWKFGAHVIGSDGNPAPVKYVLKG